MALVHAESAAKCLAGLTNKLADNEDLTAKLTKAAAGIGERRSKWPCAEPTTDRMPIGEAQATVRAWLLKALIMRAHPLASQIATQHFASLADEQIGGVSDPLHGVPLKPA